MAISGDGAGEIEFQRHILMKIKQLDPPIPVLTPRGPGLAHFLRDYGPEHHDLWTVFLDANGECWSFRNPEIRARPNPSMGREGIGERALVGLEIIGSGLPRGSKIVTATGEKPFPAQKIRRKRRINSFKPRKK